MAEQILTRYMSESIQGVSAARYNIDAGDGNLTIDPEIDGAEILASGSLQYLENQAEPEKSVTRSNGIASLRLAAQRRKRIRMPWAACKGATHWQVHLNPQVAADITAHSNGGNVRLDLVGMQVTQVTAETGGGNMEVALPSGAAELCVKATTGAGNVKVAVDALRGSNELEARTGAGNVVVEIPRGLAARIRLTYGLGKAVIDPCLDQTGKGSYQSSNYEVSADKVDIALHSGAGDIRVVCR